MIKTLTTLAETAIVVGSTTTTGSTAVRVERDEEGNIKEVWLNKKRATTAACLSTTAVSATTGAQELSEKRVLDNIANAQEVVESMSDEELASLEAMLSEKSLEFSLEDQATVATEKTEAKTLIRK